jgi:nucleoside-diphosphate-sugar epimerase
MTVLLLGGTGRVGNRVLTQLLQRNIKVKAIVRSPDKLAPEQQSNPLLTCITANLTSLTVEDMKSHLKDTTAVISCLGHTMSFNELLAGGLFVYNSAKAVIEAAESLNASPSIKFVHLSTVGIQNPDAGDTIRSWFEKGFISALNILVPLRDSQMTANYLHGLGKSSKSTEWVAVRPDAFIEGDVSKYMLHDHVVSSLFKPGTTKMSNIAHFMCDLVEKEELWAQWKFKLPVIIDNV